MNESREGNLIGRCCRLGSLSCTRSRGRLIKCQVLKHGGRMAYSWASTAGLMRSLWAHRRGLTGPGVSRGSRRRRDGAARTSRRSSTFPGTPSPSRESPRFPSRSSPGSPSRTTLQWWHPRSLWRGGCTSTAGMSGSTRPPQGAQVARQPLRGGGQLVTPTTAGPGWRS